LTFIRLSQQLSKLNIGSLMRVFSTYTARHRPPVKVLRALCLSLPVDACWRACEKDLILTEKELASNCDVFVNKRATVLLVDDHAGFLEQVRGLLDSSYEIVGTAGNGNAAVEVARKLHPDIVVLDIEMPVLDGIAAARSIRKDGLAKKIVFLTMHSDADYVSAALEAGAHGYVFKSLLNHDLIFALQEVMANRIFVSAHNHVPKVGPLG
jgi:CheY-like chemotaxis protein